MDMVVMPCRPATLEADLVATERKPGGKMRLDEEATHRSRSGKALQQVRRPGFAQPGLRQQGLQPVEIPSQPRRPAGAGLRVAGPRLHIAPVTDRRRALASLPIG